jgi:Glycosyl transferase family 2
VATVSVSVAMATYNGASFLAPQLASIAAQTRQPTEMVVCDDGSVDETVEIVERFGGESAFEVRLVHNSAQLGYRANFLKAARLCRCDVIAWSDQDDLWMPGKLARCLEEFEKDPDVLLVVHSRQIGDWVKPGWVRRGRPVVRGVRRRKLHTPTSLPFWISAPGYACVVSRRVVEIGDALATTVPGASGRFSGHDTWTSFLAGASGKVVLIPDVLVQYRQHHGQVAGAPPPQTPGSRVKASATRSRSEIEDDLEPQVPRAFFRASLLAVLAAQLDGAEAGSGRGALHRSKMWRRHGEALQRRLELWRRRRGSVGVAACLVRSIASGDYRRRDRGGLGLPSFARDLWRVTDVRHRA